MASTTTKDDNEGTNMPASTLPTVDAARLELARSANYEVQVLAETLRKFIDENEPSSEIAVVSRGILTRISDLRSE